MKSQPPANKSMLHYVGQFKIQNLICYHVYPRDITTIF
jgi:hypothetical protein